MPPYQPQHTVLLDDSLFCNARPEKRSLGNDVKVIPSKNAQLSNRLSHPDHRAVVLLDEDGLQQALDAKSHRRRGFEESSDFGQSIRISMDRSIDSFDVSRRDIAKQRITSSDAKPHRRRGVEENSNVGQNTRISMDGSIDSFDVSSRDSFDVSSRDIVKQKIASLVVLHEKRRLSKESLDQAGKDREESRMQKPEIFVRGNKQHESGNQGVVLKKKIVCGADSDGTKRYIRGPEEGSESERSRTKVPVLSQQARMASHPLAPKGGKRTGGSQNSPRVLKSTAVEPSECAPEESAPLVTAKAKVSKPNTPVAHGQSTAWKAPPQLMTDDSTSSAQKDGIQGLRETPSEGINPRPRIPTVKDSARARKNLRSYPIKVTSLPAVPLESVQSHPTASSCEKKDLENRSLNSSSSLGRPSPSSRRIRGSHDGTGCIPNHSVSAATMAKYTEAVGGLQTVSNTVRIFYESVKLEPILQGFFNQIQQEKIRDEFTILANLTIPTKYEERMKNLLPFHCHLLESGADIDSLIVLWESAIEANWVESQTDNSRQLIVGPSRVVCNLRGLERQYAMFVKADTDRMVKKQVGTTRSRHRPPGFLGMFGKR